MELARSLMSIAVFVAFAGIVWWAYAPSRKSRFEDDAHSIFAGHDE